MGADLWIVIVNWNLKDDTLACLESLEQAGADLGHVVLIDNGSADGSVEALNARYGARLCLIANPKNLGYAPAVNQGVRFALQRGAGWVFLLNNDTLVATDFFSVLHRAQESGYAILAPAIFYHAAPQRLWYLGDTTLPGTLITRNRWQGKPLPAGLPALLPVDFVSGCAMLVRREVFEQAGLFDPGLVMYGEEIDFTWRARLRGYRAACVPAARMWHKVSLSAGRVPAQTRFLRIRNQARFYRRYARGLQRPLMWAFSLLRILRLTLTDLLGGQAVLIAPLWRGWLAGWYAPLTNGEHGNDGL